MARLIVFALAGMFGQLVDGALGMGFGVTCSTVLLSNGVSPAISSASVHLAKVGTTFTSGMSHWRFGNVSWPLVARIAVPGVVGAVLGATVLSSLDYDWLPVGVAVVLLGLGALLVWRSVRGDLRGGGRPASSLKTRLLAPLGLSAGFIDAIGGGGWGPVATPTLLTAGKAEPRIVIGSVSAAELFVSIAASVSFLAHLGGAGVKLSYVLALMGGGVVTAPVAAWLVKKIDPSALGVVVGTLLLVTNIRTLLTEAGVAGPVRLPVLLVVGVVGVAVAVRVARRPAPAPAAEERPVHGPSAPAGVLEPA